VILKIHQPAARRSDPTGFKLALPRAGRIPSDASLGQARLTDPAYRCTKYTQDPQVAKSLLRRRLRGIRQVVVSLSLKLSRSGASLGFSISGAADMTTGIIKWINEAKGFGLITPDSGGKDVFARFTPVRVNDKSRSEKLKLKQKVSFDITPGPDGDLALNIKPIG
jgi:CspA family cold shock protein